MDKDLHFLELLIRSTEKRKKYFPKDQIELRMLEGDICIIDHSTMYTGKTLEQVLRNMRDDYSIRYCELLLKNDGFVEMPKKEDVKPD